MANPLNELLSSMLNDIAELSAEMAGKGSLATRLTVDEWRDDMASLLTEFHAAAYFTGRGTRDMSDDAQELLAEVLEEQLAYLDQFAARVKADGWKEAFAARAALYAGSIKISYSAGETDLLPLPSYPAQGTDCVTNCGCLWDIKVVDRATESFDCYWRRGKNDSCETCREREKKWSPYKIRFGEGV